MEIHDFRIISEYNVFYYGQLLLVNDCIYRQGTTAGHSHIYDIPVVSCLGVGTAAFLSSSLKLAGPRKPDWLGWLKNATGSLPCALSRARSTSKWLLYLDLDEFLWVGSVSPLNPWQPLPLPVPVPLPQECWKAIHARHQFQTLCPPCTHALPILCLFWADPLLTLW